MKISVVDVLETNLWEPNRNLKTISNEMTKFATPGTVTNSRSGCRILVKLKTPLQPVI